MSAEDTINLSVFLWVITTLGVVRFMQAAHPYIEDSEEQKAEDREQAA